MNKMMMKMGDIHKAADDERCTESKGKRFVRLMVFDSVGFNDLVLPLMRMMMMMMDW